MKNKKKKRQDEASQIGRYEIRKELGHGVMGVVYEAHDPALGRAVALKTIRPAALGSADERAEYEKRFLAEARIAARLSHPGIVVVHDVGRDPEGTLYIALEYLHGRTLAEWVSSEGALPWREALRIVARVAVALHYAHAEGVVHRDIKPANIMILRSGEPKIMDFGIAKLEAGQLTAAGRLFGTPLYMAPEQALGEPVDRRSDLFSLGSVAYTLLTGRPPFDAPNVPSILARVTSKDPRPPTALVPELPPDVDYVIARAMAKSPDDRYPDGGTLAEDVEDVLAERPPRHRAGWTPPERGEGTLVSAAVPTAPREPELELQLVEEAPVRRRRRSPSARLVVLLGVTAAAWFVLHPGDWAFWRDILRRAAGSRLAREAMARLPRLEPSPAQEPAVASVEPPAAETPGADAQVPPPAPSSAEPSVPAPSEAEPSAPAPPATATSAPEPSAPAAEATGTPSPQLTPSSPEASRPRAPTTPAPGRLVVDFEHHLRRGTLRVSIDGQLALKEDFDSRRTRKILAFELRKGVVQEVLTLPPGRHEVRVEVRWDDNVRTARIAGTFRSGATRRLEVKVARIGGKLTLAWK